MEATTSTKSHADLLHPRVKEFHGKLATLGENDTLLEILYRKGLTTPVQWFFIRQQVETMHKLADALTESFNALVQGCQMILEEQR